MTEPAIRSELTQVLDAIQGMQAAIQTIDKKLDSTLPPPQSALTSWMKS
ncbi:MAG TPA: hypothetical protein IGP91_02330 [Thermosynechococcus sp. M46_R2017_013]|nr:hypothetical protein [Thermosynechococcus sp. M46_R2017_013]